MTSLMPHPVPGHIVPGTSEPFIKVLKPWGWETQRIRPGIISETPYGPPIKPEPVAQPTPQPPKPIGEEAHHGIMQKLSAMVAQHSTQIVDAMPSQRPWRG